MRIRHSASGAIRSGLAGSATRRALLRLSEHERLQRLPLHVVLRGPVLASVVKEIAARLFGERVHRAAGSSGCRRAATRWTATKFLRDSSSVQVVLPGESGCRRSGVPLDMAGDASRVAGTLGQEDGLHLGLEELEIQRPRCGGGSRWLLAQQPSQHQGPGRNDCLHETSYWRVHASPFTGSRSLSLRWRDCQPRQPISRPARPPTHRSIGRSHERSQRLEPSIAGDAPKRARAAVPLRILNALIVDATARARLENTIRTRFTEAFGVRHPIVCAPMALVTGGRLAAAVSRAGGLGIVGGGYAGTLGGEPDVGRELEHVRGQTFGVGFITWALARAPHLLDEALTHSPACVFLSFGDAGPFSRTDSRERRQVDLPGAGPASHRSGPRRGRRGDRRARKRGRRSWRQPLDAAVCAGSRRLSGETLANHAAARGGGHRGRPRPGRRTHAGRRRRGRRLQVLVVGGSADAGGRNRSSGARNG